MKSAVLVAVVLALAGCSDDPPQSGYVVEKKYDDPDDWIYWQPVYGTRCEPRTHTTYSNGRSTTYTDTECHQYVQSHIPVQMHDGPHWKLLIRDDADKKHKDKGWVEVTERNYEAYGVGDHWPDPR